MSYRRRPPPPKLRLPTRFPVGAAPSLLKSPSGWHPVSIVAPPRTPLPPAFNDVSEFLSFTSSWSGCKKKRKVLSLIGYGMLLSYTSPTLVADDIKTLVFGWMKHRWKMKDIKWVEWCISPFLCLSFFHGIINRNKRHNRINGLIIDGVWCTDPESIRKEVWEFFKNKFEEPHRERPKFVNNNFNKLGETHASHEFSY
ncbi:hypothetical protein LXL04_001036 [Taraxacum kok-saghyz]